jgi:alkylglycerol monooxygenase
VRYARGAGMPNLIALTIPFFFALIALELVVARKKRRSVYRLGDALTDLSCGIASQVPLAFYGAFQVGVYAWVFDHHRLATMQPAWLPWLVAFVAVDFIYYWWHRGSHELNFLWAAHVVHHQSEDYNLAVALRQAVLTSWTALPFYLPLALAGVPTHVYVAVYSLSTLYQFWIHTELVGRIGSPVGWLLNVPQHHRVHHAINPQYLDKNYGATLMVWDRLFGTFEEEREPCVYGTTTPLASFNPFWAQVEPLVELSKKSARARGIERLLLWLRSPAATAGEPKPSSALARAKYDPEVPQRTKVYVAIQHGVLVVATFSFIWFHERLPPGTLVVSAAAILGGLVALGGLLEARSWAKPVEALRLAAGAASVGLLVIG